MNYQYAKVLDFTRDCVETEFLKIFYNNRALQDDKPMIIHTLIEQKENVFNHCIFLIYYTIYRGICEKHSIRYHLGAKERDESDYDKALYNYKKYRKLKDEQTKKFFDDKNFHGLYNSFSNKKGESIGSLNGQEISETGRFELFELMHYDIFKMGQSGAISSSKKCSNVDFEDNKFPQIQLIYNDIADSFSESEMPYFMRSVEYFALETTYHFEKAYLIAEKIKDLKCRKEVRDREKNILYSIHKFCNDNHKYANSLVLGYEDIFKAYNFPEYDAEDIYSMVNVCCYIINTTVHNFFDNEKEWYNWSVPHEIDEFCKHFFGNGQHIKAKKLENIRIKDFRDFYK